MSDAAFKAQLKARVVDSIRIQVAADLAAAEEAHRQAVESATHEESRSEHDKDTRATEASYLARGLARRVVELQAAAAALRSEELDRVFAAESEIAVGALVEVEDEEGATSWLLLATDGGGISAVVDEIEVKVVTTRAPVGMALKGALEDDEVTVSTPKGARDLIISSVL